MLLTVAGRARRHREQPLDRAREAPTRRVRRGDAPVLLVTAAVLALVLAPVAALVGRSLHVDGRWSLAEAGGVAGPTGVAGPRVRG